VALAAATMFNVAVYLPGSVHAAGFSGSYEIVGALIDSLSNADKLREPLEADRSHVGETTTAYLSDETVLATRGG
jgi:hypothetical protein